MGVGIGGFWDKDSLAESLRVDKHRKISAKEYGRGFLIKANMISESDRNLLRASTYTIKKLMSNFRKVLKKQAIEHLNQFVKEIAE